jgi:hypothetical protein
MTFDEYNDAITRIHNQLQDIANQTLNQALTGCANPSNPGFLLLMHRHTQLTKLSTELTERMIKQMTEI